MKNALLLVLLGLVIFLGTKELGRRYLENHYEVTLEALVKFHLEYAKLERDYAHVVAGTNTLCFNANEVGTLRQVDRAITTAYIAYEQARWFLVVQDFLFKHDGYFIEKSLFLGNSMFVVSIQQIKLDVIRLYLHSAEGEFCTDVYRPLEGELV